MTEKLTPRMEALIPPWQRILAEKFPSLETQKLVEAPAELTPSEVEAFREVGRRWLYFFTVFVLGYDRLTPPGGLHWHICERLTDMRKPLFLLLYRGAFKSTIGSIAWPLWEVARDPANHDHIHIVSDLELGKAFLFEIGNHCQYNERLRVLYPELERDTRMWKGTVRRVKGRGVGKTGPTWEVRTTKQPLAGRHVGSIGVDDLVNEQNYPSRPEQDRLKDYLRRAWPALDTDKLVFKATRYADYDAYSLPLEEWYPAGLIDVFVQPLRGTATLTDAGKVELELNDEYAHPQEWNAEREAVEREGSSAFIFRTQYFLDTSRVEGVSFEASWIQRISQADLNEIALTVYVYGDPASGQGTSRPAIAAVGISDAGNLYPLATRSDYKSEGEFVDGLFQFYHLFKPAEMATEGWGTQKYGIPQQIEARSRKLNVWLPFQVLPGLGHASKEQRIREVLRPPYRWGNVYHPPGIPMGGEYETQYASFPLGKFNDELDAVAGAVMLAMKYGYQGAKAEEETAQEQRRGEAVTVEQMVNEMLHAEEAQEAKSDFW